MRLLFAIALLFVLALAAGTGGQTSQAAEQTVTIQYGPYSVPGGSEEMPGSTNNQPMFNVAKPCTNCYITGMVPDLVYADGSEANMDTGAMLHHMVLFSTPQVDQTCSGFPWSLLGERFFASGNERSPFTASPGYGYYVPANAQWQIVADLMNHMPEARNMYLRFTYTYRPASDGLLPLTPVWLDVQNCASSEYDIPAGYSDTHWDWTSTVTGDLMQIGGHVHGHGINVSAQLVDDGDYICNSLAVYQEGSPAYPAPVTAGDEGHPAAAATMPDEGEPMTDHIIDGMTGCAPVLRINEGETIRLHARYNPDSAHTGVMGIMMAFVYETTAPVPDADADSVRDELDNCPNWPNPGQGWPTWNVPSGDSDCDGYPSSASASGRAPESFIGTKPGQTCGGTPTGNDEPLPDAWPPDFDDNQLANILDVGKLSPVFNSIGPGAPYQARFDFNSDGRVTILDVGQFSVFFGKRCA